jgi:hypothetical protein
MVPGLLLLLSLAQDPAELDVLTRSLQTLLVANTPREIEDRKSWDKTIPLDPKLKLKSLRTIVQVDGKAHVPDGSWSRSKITLNDPARDVQIYVRDLKPLEGGKQHIVLELVVRCGWEYERKEWEKGFQLIGVTANGTTRAQLFLAAEYSTKLDVATFPPQLKVDLKVTQTKLDLREFEVKRLTKSKLLSLQAKLLSDEIRDILQVLITRKEDKITNALNSALAKVLKK